MVKRFTSYGSATAGPLGLAIGCALLLWILVGSACAAVEVISLRYRSAAEVLPIVRTMLSPDGKISADDRTNSLITVPDCD